MRIIVNIISCAFFSVNGRIYKYKSQKVSGVSKPRLWPQQFPIAQLQLKASFRKEETARLQTGFSTRETEPKPPD